jgi:hypothetical protein
MKRLFGTRTLLLALLALAIPASSFAAVAISITVAPPLLPVYVQPLCPTDGYLWTPGYWAWGPAGYYWVPGVWVAPPAVGVLWTPGYWGFAGGFYLWHAGFWGPHVGFYGGVNYGFGYPGSGFIGGVWSGSVFRYNTAVVNVNRTVVHNVYVDRTVIHNTAASRTSFNGPGGLSARPTQQESTAMAEHHMAPTPNQMSHETVASHSAVRPSAPQNGARPQVSNTHPPANHPVAPIHAAPASHAVEANHRAPASRPVAPNHSAPAYHPATPIHSAPANHPVVASHPAPANHPAPQQVAHSNSGGRGRGK